ncbi:MAG TPA: hypothetical protein DCM73_06365 [Clostridiales bacterium]|nr:hypothetical protein [Clostridiales bacterium]
MLILASKAVLPIFGKIYFNEPPFSMPLDEANQNKKLDEFFKAIGVVICAVILHAISHIIPMGTWIYAGLLLIGIPLIRRFIVPAESKVQI